MSIQETDAASESVAVAPRVKLAAIEEKIVNRYDFTAGEALGALDMPMPLSPALRILSLCILVMKNGFSVVGKSAPASPENFNADLGRRFAYEDAIRQLWPLEGYALREKLADGE